MIYQLLLGIIIGYLYYQTMEKSLPTETNCSFMASPMTDYLAFAWGAMVIYYGNLYKNDILIFLGVTVIVEHVFQLLRK